MKQDFSIQLVNARNFVKTAPEGDINLNMAREMMLRAAQAANKAGDADVVVDCRSITGHLSLVEIASLVYMMMEHRSLFRRKVAVLAPVGQAVTQQMKFMEDFAVNRGFRVGAFEDYETAMNWLMPSTPIALA